MTRRFALLLLASFWIQGCALLNSEPPIQAGPFITEFGVVGPDEGGRTSVEASRAIELTYGVKKVMWIALSILHFRKLDDWTQDRIFGNDRP